MHTLACARLSLDFPMNSPSIGLFLVLPTHLYMGEFADTHEQLLCQNSCAATSLVQFLHFTTHLTSLMLITDTNKSRTMWLVELDPTIPITCDYDSNIDK